MLVMRKKEVVTSRHVAEALGGIEEATFEEEMERKRRGLTLEPKARREQLLKTGPVHGTSPAALEGREGEKTTEERIKNWLEENPDYRFRAIDPEWTEIRDDSGIDVPAEFVDYLIDNAAEAAESKKLNLFGKVEKIKIKPISVSAEVISLVIRDTENTTVVLNFSANPPFNLKESNSTLGITYFK